MASGQTINYNLNQWEAGDKVLREEFNADNAKIDGVLAGKIGHLELIGESVLDYSLSRYNMVFKVGLDQVQWSDWEMVAIAFLCPSNSGGDCLHMDLDNVSCDGYLGSGIGYRKIGPLGCLFFPRHNSENPIRLLGLPGAEICTSTSTFQALTAVRFIYSGTNNFNISAGAKAVIWGLR